jgi:hypothetical protein
MQLAELQRALEVASIRRKTAEAAMTSQSAYRAAYDYPPEGIR